MKTFETEKHNIPEGATHYCDESDDFRFSWVMFDDGGALNVYTTARGWWIFNHSKFEDKVKPIPKIPTETTEEKEALDEKTYRYEKVTDSIFDLKEEFERGDLFVQILGNSGEYRSIEEETTLIDEIRDDNVYRCIEATERELFIDHMRGRYPGVCIGVFEYAYEKLKLVNGKG